MTTESTTGTVLCQRRTLLERQRCYRLSDEELTVSENGRPTRHIPYREIRQVNLACSPRRLPNPTNYFLCVIHPAGGKKLVLANQDYRSSWTYADQSPEYVSFIRTLHQRLDGMDVVYQQGIGRVGYWTLMACVAALAAAMLALLVIGLVHDYQPFTEIWLYGLLPLLTMLYLNQKYNSPHRYGPQQIPGSLLPSFSKIDAAPPEK